MQSTTKTKVRYQEETNGVKKQYITSETAWNKIVKEATEANEQPPELLAQGTFAYSLASTVDEAVSLAGGQGVGEYENIDVFLSVFNYGASLRQDNEANDILASDTFAPWEGAKDVSYAVAQKSERAKMTPEEKAAKTLGISPDQLRAALATIQAAQSAGA
jgi:hypothetical protein